jgi:hypothetical protein
MSKWLIAFGFILLGQLAAKAETLKLVCNETFRTEWLGASANPNPLSLKEDIHFLEIDLQSKKVKIDNHADFELNDATSERSFDIDNNKLMPLSSTGKIFEGVDFSIDRRTGAFTILKSQIQGTTVIPKSEVLGVCGKDFPSKLF